MSKESKDRVIFSTQLVESMGVDSAFLSKGKGTSDFVDRLVRRAICKLNVLDRKIVEDYYYQGKTVNQIAQELENSPQFVDRHRLRALETVKEYLKLEAKVLAIDSSHNNCIICDHEESKKVNQFIIEYLEKSGYRLFGIRKRLMKKFGFNDISICQVEQHCKHMNHLLDGDKEIKEENATKFHLSFAIPMEMKERADDIAALCGTTYIDILKQAVVEGLDNIERYLVYNAEFTRKAAEIHRKLRAMDIG